MNSRIETLTSFYGSYAEDSRLGRTRQGQLEYITTMSYIHRYAQPGTKLLEIGAGTGRYSIALAREGYTVTAVELVTRNLEILKKNAGGIENLHAVQGDALDLSPFPDQTFDVTLVFGPMYHLYEKEDVQKALKEAIRVTKKNGVILCAFLSIYAIIYNDYLNGGLEAGLKLNFTEDYSVKHFEAQLFTGYDITEFESLFRDTPTEHIATVAADGILEHSQSRKDFLLSDQDFQRFAEFHLATCEKRELLGSSSHLLYICRKI